METGLDQIFETLEHLGRIITIADQFEFVTTGGGQRHQLEYRLAVHLFSVAGHLERRLETGGDLYELTDRPCMQTSFVGNGDDLVQLHSLHRYQDRLATEQRGWIPIIR